MSPAAATPPDARPIQELVNGLRFQPRTGSDARVGAPLPARARRATGGRLRTTAPVRVGPAAAAAALRLPGWPAARRRRRLRDDLRRLGDPDGRSGLLLAVAAGDDELAQHPGAAAAPARHAGAAAALPETAARRQFEALDRDHRTEPWLRRGRHRDPRRRPRRPFTSSTAASCGSPTASTATSACWWRAPSAPAATAASACSSSTASRHATTRGAPT